MREYRFELEPLIPPGRVVFVIRNEGELSHEMSLAILPPDFPPLDEQLRGPTRRPVATLAYLPALPPRSRGALAADLEPGRYGLISFTRQADGQQDQLKGMSAEFQVR